MNSAQKSVGFTLHMATNLLVVKSSQTTIPKLQDLVAIQASPSNQLQIIGTVVDVIGSVKAPCIVVKPAANYQFAPKQAVYVSKSKQKFKKHRKTHKKPDYVVDV